MKIVNPSDKLLNLMFAREVAHLTFDNSCGREGWYDKNKPEKVFERYQIDYTYNFNSLLPYINTVNQRITILGLGENNWSVSVSRDVDDRTAWISAADKSLNHATMIALLRLNGIKIEITKTQEEQKATAEKLLPMVEGKFMKADLTNKGRYPKTPGYYVDPKLLKENLKGKKPSVFEGLLMRGEVTTLPGRHCPQEKVKSSHIEPVKPCPRTNIDLECRGSYTPPANAVLPPKREPLLSVIERVSTPCPPPPAPRTKISAIEPWPDPVEPTFPPAEFVEESHVPSPPAKMVAEPVMVEEGISFWDILKRMFGRPLSKGKTQTLLRVELASANELLDDLEDHYNKTFTRGSEIDVDNNVLEHVIAARNKVKALKEQLEKYEN